MEIVVTSGQFGGRETEILNLESFSWRLGPLFPSENAIYLGQSVPYAESFLVVGGHRLFDDTESKQVWYFDARIDKWIDMGVTLDFEKVSYSAIWIPDDKVVCSVTN